MGCYTLLVLTIIFLRWYLVRQNKKKDAVADELAAQGIIGAADVRMVHAFDDLTDQENPDFRYVF